jgi:hypothetical protein
MLAPMKGHLLPLALVLGLVLVLGARGASADVEAPVDAVLRCPASQGTGRVRCTVEISARGGATISWADAVIRSTPTFATPLRGRLAPSDAIDSTPERWRWEFALAARTRGRGEVGVTVRAVVCEHGACRPTKRDVSTTLVVGE